MESSELGLKFDASSWLPWKAPDPAPRPGDGNAALFGRASLSESSFCDYFRKLLSFRCIFALFQLTLMKVLWFIVDSKCLIKAWGWVPIIFSTLLELTQFSQNIKLFTPYLLQKYCTNSKNEYQIIFRKIILYISKF